jgi:hypothetical protein
MDIFAQIVPQAQRRPLEQGSEFAKAGAVDSRSIPVNKSEFLDGQEWLLKFASH